MSDAADQRDRDLAAILERLTDLPSDQRPTLEKLTADHPHLADDLRQLWGAVMVVDAVALEQARRDRTEAFGDPRPSLRRPTSTRRANSAISSWWRKSAAAAWAPSTALANDGSTGRWP